VSELQNNKTEQLVASADDGGNIPSLSWDAVTKVAAPLLKQLDHDHKGGVSRQELGEALTNPHISANQAAAVAGLYGNFNKVAELGGNCGSINDKSLSGLYRTFYNAEKRASDLIGMDDWTKSNFRSIDRNGKGLINLTDVNSAMSLSTGTDKTILQRLGANFADITRSGRASAADVTQYVDKYLTRDPNFVFTDSFERVMARVALAESNKVSHDVFATPQQPEKSITAAAVVQGFLKDCSFAAPLASLAQARPADVAKMVDRAADGSFDIKFPGSPHKVNVKAPTAAEQGLLNAAGRFGYWPSLLEKAYGQREVDASPQLQKAHALPEEVLDQRAPLKGAIEMLTGHPATEKFLLYTNKSDVVDILQKRVAEGQHKIVTLGTGNTLDKGTTRDGFELNHAFSVLAFKPDNHGDGQVTVRDSYGLGGPRNDGVRTISVDQLKENFTDIVYEN
jgi:hypothetical protein